MNSLGEWALTSLVSYGVPILLVMSFVGSLGIPFPNTLVIIAAGAFAREGILDWRMALLACLLGATLADNCEYFIGRRAKGWVEQHYGNQLVWQKAHVIIRRQGGWAIFLTRFWLMPLAPAINLIAGNRYPYWRFLFFDLTGQLLWVWVYGGLGYIFVDRWKLVIQAVNGFSWASFGLMILATATYWLVSKIKKWKRYNRQWQK